MPSSEQLAFSLHPLVSTILVPMISNLHLSPDFETHRLTSALKIMASGWAHAQTSFWQDNQDRLLHRIVSLHGSPNDARYYSICENDICGGKYSK